MSGEKPAPTAAEIAEAREWLDDVTLDILLADGHERTVGHVRTLLAALDAAEAERKDAIGALDDAGVRRNDDDKVASGIESLAADRYEFSDLWTGVCDLFWPDREPDDCFGIEDVREAVEEREQRGDAAEARATAAEVELRDRRGADVAIRANLATAERERDEARALARKLAQECIDALQRNSAPSLDLRDTDTIATWKEAPRG